MSAPREPIPLKPMSAPREPLPLKPMSAPREPLPLKSMSVPGNCLTFTDITLFPSRSSGCDLGNAGYLKTSCRLIITCPV
ncbi:hypothetical protein GDO81_021555 [Engystomops pustulosus]|uniref:Uncharacterized protein n=1 Tax=Engystomops pustulosus TaxID=76066 RepID=A0AAV6YNN0_ENGPU|nr:hypothetical protein GDO81_021555 [Engystomops pustulosus]